MRVYRRPFVALWIVFVLAFAGIALGAPTSALALLPDDDIPGTPMFTSSAGGRLDRSFDEVDVHAIYLNAGQRLTAVVPPPLNSGVSLTAYGPAATSVAEQPEALSGASWSSPATLTVTARSSGIHYLAVRLESGIGGAYTLQTSAAQGEADDFVPGVALSTETTRGALGAGDVVDVFAVEVVEGNRVGLQLDQEPAGYSVQARLYAPGAGSLAARAPLMQASNGYAYATIAAKTGTYYVAVTGSVSASYTLTFAQQPTDAGDKRPGLELTASPISGRLIGSGDVDYYVTHLTAGQLFSFDMSSTSLPFAYLRGPDMGGAEWEIPWVTSTSPSDYGYGFSALISQTGTYYVEVYPGSKIATYDAVWGVGGVGLDDAIPGLPASSPATGSVSVSGDAVDVHAIDLVAGQRVVVDASRLSGALFSGRVELRGPGATDADGALTSTTFASAAGKLAHTVTRSGTYYLTVCAESGAGTYRLAWSSTALATDDTIPGLPGATGMTDALAWPLDGDDVRQVTLTQGKRYALTGTGTSGTGDGYIRLYAPDASSIDSASVASTRFYNGSAGTLYWTPRVSGTYYIRVSSTGTLGYRLNWTSAAVADDDIPGVALTASPVSGSVQEYVDPDDVYRVSLTKGERFTFSLTGSSVYASVYTTPTTSIFSGSGLSWQDNGAQHSFVAPMSGTYYVRVHGYSSSSSSYQLVWSKSTSESDDDVPGVPLGAAPRTGSVGTTDPIDVYSVYLSAGERFALDAGSGYAPLLRIIRPESASVATSTWSASGWGKLAVTAETTGTHYLLVEAQGTSGDYALNWTVGATADDDTAPGIQLPASPVSDQIGVAGDYFDYFYLDMEQGETFVATATTGAGERGPYLDLQGPANGWYYSWGQPARLPTATVLRFTAPWSGRHQIRVAEWGTNGTDYEMAWALLPATNVNDDTLPGQDLPDGLTVGEIVGDPVGYTSDVDYYSVRLAKGELLTVDDADGWVGMRLFGPGATDGVSAFAVAEGTPLTYAAPAAGTYTLEVSNAMMPDMSFTYALDVHRTQPTARPDVPGTLVTSHSVEGTVTAYDPLDDDVLAFDLTAGEWFVGAVSSGSSVDAALYGAGTTSIYDTAPLAIWPGDAARTFAYRVPATGRYYLVLRTDSWSAPWSLDWFRWSGEPDDRIPGVALPGATTQSINSSYDTTDIYRVVLGKGMSVCTTMNVDSAVTVQVACYGPNLGSLDGAASIGSTQTGTGMLIGNWTAPEDGTYYLRVQALNGGGSYSFASATRAAPVPPAAPVVLGMRPEAGALVGPNQRLLQAAVSGGTPPLSVRFEASPDDGATWTSVGEATEVGSSFYGNTAWGLAEWSTGAFPEGALRLRTIAVDADLRTAVGETVEVTNDNTPPGEPTGLVAEPSSAHVTLAWSAGAAAEPLSFEVLRRVAGGEYASLGTTLGAEWTDRTAASGIEYEYAVRAIDAALNKSDVSAYVSAALIPDTQAPIADAGVDQRVYVGQKVALDGSRSTDDRAIQAYQWDFGDGQGATDMVAAHAYPTAGTYVARLTTRDAAGNESSDTATIEVRELDASAATTLTVDVRAAGTGARLSGATVYAENAVGAKLYASTGGDGTASLMVEPGAWRVYVSAGFDYLPVKATTTVVALEPQTVRLDMQKGSLLQGDVETRLLTYPEIVAKGIDVSDPANLQTTEFTIRWGGQDLTGYISGPSGVGGGSITLPAQPASPGTPPSPPRTLMYYTELVNGEPRYACVVVGGQVSWLSEMFHTSITLINVARDPEFELADVTAELKLPDGLSLAAMVGDEQTALKQIGSIPAGESKTQGWEVRGDVAGEYHMSVDVAAKLRPSNAPMSRTFTTTEPVKIYGKGAVTTDLEAPIKVHEGEEFVVRAGMRNMTPYDASLVKAQIIAIENAQLVRGDRVQAWETVRPDETVWAEWTFVSEVTGTLSLEENEGAIEGWTRTSDISGNEVVIPFLPEDGAAEAAIEEGGRLLRYYRVTEPPVEGEPEKGVWFVDATATVSVAGEAQSRETTVAVRDEYPAGVFAVPFEDLGVDGADFTVDITGLRADKAALDTSACVPFHGTVGPRNGAERTMALGSKLGIQAGLILQARLEEEYSTAYTMLGDSGVRTDIDATEKLGAGISLSPGPKLEMDTPFVSGGAGASAEAMAGFSVLHGISSQYDHPLTDDDEALALAMATMDMKTLSGLSATKRGHLHPKLVAFKMVLGDHTDPELYETRQMGGFGVWGTSSVNVGASVETKALNMSSVPVAGAKLDLVDAGAEYSREFQAINYPKGADAISGSASEISLKLIDRVASNVTLFGVEGFLGPFKASDEAYEDKLEGAVEIEGVFDPAVIGATLAGEKDIDECLNRIIVTVDDSANNRKQEFVIEKESLDELRTHRKDGKFDNAWTLLSALRRSTEPGGSSPGAIGVGPDLEDGTRDLLMSADEVSQFGGEDPKEYKMSWGFDIKALANAKADYEDSLTFSASNLLSRGELRDRFFYPVEEYDDEPKTPNYLDFDSQIKHVMQRASDHVGPAIGEMIEERLTAAADLITSVGDAIASVFTGQGARVSALAEPDGTQDSLSIELPADALSSEVTVTVGAVGGDKSAQSFDADGHAVHGGVTLLGSVHTVSPETTLSAAATLTATWPQAGSLSVDPGSIGLWSFDSATGRWHELPGQRDAGAIVATTTTLGTFAVGADLSGPTFAVSSPIAGTATPVLRPWLLFETFDGASDVDTDSVSVELDGTGLGVVVSDDGSCVGQLPALAPGEHLLAITASDSRGNASSHEVTFTVDVVIPDAPTGLVAVQVEDTAQLEWAPSASAGEAYRVYRRSGEQTRTTLVAETGEPHYEDWAPPGGVVSTYTVSVVDAAGNEGPSSDEALLTPRYGARMNLVLSRDEAGAVSVETSLTDESGVPLTGKDYVLETSTDQVEWTEVAALTQEATASVTVLEAPAETTYYRGRFAGTAAWRTATAQDSVVVPLDTEPPVTTRLGVPIGWASKPVTITLTAEDDSAVETFYLLGEEVLPRQYAGPFEVSAEGTTRVTYWSVDAKGNTEARAWVDVRVDSAKPTLSLQSSRSPEGYVTVSASAADALSGVGALRYSLDGGGWVAAGAVRVEAPGAHVVTFEAADHAANSTFASSEFLVASPTRITLGSPAAATVAYGSAHTLRGTLGDHISGVANAPVVIESSSNGVDYATAGQATTAADGTFAMAVRPKVRTWYRARFAETSTRMGSVSPAAVISVKAAVGTPVAPLTMSRSRSYAVSGSLKPRHTAGGRAVRIYKYRYVAGRWKSYGYVAAKSANYSTYTKYSASIRLPYAGRWRLRAYHADAGHMAAWSPKYDTVTVK